MVEDKLLILRFKQGNHEALRQIYDKYKAELLKLAVVLIGNKNMAEDIVHDVFVKFAESADRIKLTGSLKSYLVTSVINRVRNHLRDSNRHREPNLEGADLLSSPDRGPRQWAVLSERLKLLSKALCELPYEQREVISLRMEMDMTFRRIAALQNASVNTVKGRYRYGLISVITDRDPFGWRLIWRVISWSVSNNGKTPIGKGRLPLLRKSAPITRTSRTNCLSLRFPRGRL